MTTFLWYLALMLVGGVIAGWLARNHGGRG